MFKIVNKEEYAEVISRNRVLESRNKELKRQRNSSETRITNYQIKCDELKSKLLELNIEREQIHEKLRKLQAAKGGFVKKINDLNEENKQLKSELLQRTIDVQQMNEQLAKLKRENNFLKRPTLQELKTEKMNKVDRKRLIK